MVRGATERGRGPGARGGSLGGGRRHMAGRVGSQRPLATSWPRLPELPPRRGLAPAPQQRGGGGELGRGEEPREESAWFPREEISATAAREETRAGGEEKV